MFYVVPLVCITMNTVSIGYCAPAQEYDSQLEIVVEEFKRQRIHPPDRNANGDFTIPTDSREVDIIE